MRAADVDVVVLTYHTAALAVEAVRSARDNGAGSICVVDNGSTDDSPAILEKGAGEFAEIVRMPSNLGFPAGHNRGSRAGKAPLVLFMNSDARLGPDAIARMAEAFDDPKIGAAAPALYYPDGRPQASAYFFISPLRIANALLGVERLAGLVGCPRLRGNVDPRRNGDYSGRVQSLYGSCFMVRRKAFEEVGGLDEAFFLYCEETDLFMRLAERGWEMHRVASARAVHIEGGTSRKAPVRYFVIRQESLQIFARKHFGLLGRVLTFAASVVGLGARVALAPSGEDRDRYRAALGSWLGWTPSADPRRGSPILAA